MKRLIWVTVAVAVIGAAALLLIRWGPPGLLVHADEPPAGATASEQLTQAMSLEESKQYDQAESIYRRIVAAYPGTSEAFLAQVHLVRVKLGVRQWDEAVTECDTLIAGAPDHPDLAATVLETAQVLTKSGKTKKAIRFFEYYIGRWPDSSPAVEIKKDLALLYARSGNPAVDSLLQELQNTLPPSGDLAELITKIGAAVFSQAQDSRSHETYAEALGYLQSAEQMYQAHVSSWNTESRAIRARQLMIQALRAMKDESAAALAEDRLLASYACSDSEHALAEALCVLADEHRGKGRHARACQLYQHALSGCPGSGREYDLSSGLARSSIATADYATAQAMAGQLISTYSDRADFIRRMNEIAWDYHAGRQDGLAEAVYRHVLDNLGDRKDAIFSQSALVIIKMEAGESEAASVELAKLVNVFPDDNSRKPEALRQVAAAYAHRKRHAEASDLYRKAIGLAQDRAFIQQMTSDYLQSRVHTIGTADDAEAVYQECLAIVAANADNSIVVRDAIETAISGYGSFGARHSGMAITLETADRLMTEYGSGAPLYQQALARHVRAWALAWNGRHEEAIQELLSLVTDYAQTADKDVERLCAISLGHAYGYALAHLRQPERAEQFLGEIRSRWPDGRYESVIRLYVTHVALNMKKSGDR